MEQDQQNMSANVQVHAEVQAQANDGRLNGNAEEKTTSTTLGQSVDGGTDNVDKNDKNMQWVILIFLWLIYNRLQIPNVHDCNGTNIVMRWKMKYSIQQGEAELIETVYPSSNEIFVPLHEWENTHYLFYITCTKIQFFKQI